MAKKPVALIVLDGFAYGENYEGNAIEKANIPNFNKLITEFPNSILGASGEAVGLPEGQMGNSEVGHLNLGAGRIVYQSLTRINVDIRNNSFYKNAAISNAITSAKNNNKSLHIMGLLSDGGVHSHIEHIVAIINIAKMNGLDKVYIHAFLDGRDVAPKSAEKYVDGLQAEINQIGLGQIATVSGRYYAMDRDKNFDRTQLAYDVMVHGKGNTFKTANDGISASYNDGIIDEFVVPFAVEGGAQISDGDSVVFANFRPDRAIQIATAISNPEASGIIDENYPKDINFVSMMLYSNYVNGDIAYGLQRLDNMLGDYISEQGLNQLRIAETEKYAHVTFFFDGGVDKEIPNSERVLINSPKVATYDLKPEMSAYEVTEAVLEELDKDIHDVIILNFANCDMVGHTGVMDAVVKAVETVDECLGKVVDKILEKGGQAIITADHGNAEKLLDESGDMFTAHTENPVPVIITNKDIQLRDNGVLGDIAPTLLDMLNLEKPVEMTGNTIIKSR